jgi:hypothetical protein
LRRRFVSAYVTDSRLMGVFVVYVRWEINAADAREDWTDLHQFFYIETTEIGIEAYRGIRGDDGVAVLEAEQSMAGGLGAEKVDLTEREACLLLQNYAAYNKRFRESLPEGRDEYGFILDEEIEASEDEQRALFAKTCKALENDNELVNYFLMRYFSGDADAVRYLADCEMPEAMPSAKKGDMLCMNKVRRHSDVDGTGSMVCESLIESGTDHRIIVSEIRVEAGKIKSVGVISDFAISGAETAMKLERPEFITVYEIFTDPESVMEYIDDHYLSAMQRDTDAGRLYLRFNENNGHVKKPLYRLNDDVSGMIFVSDEAQLVFAAYSLSQIHRLEREAQSWPFSRQLLPVAKYEFKEDVFYDFINSEVSDFVHFVEYICDFDPEDK